jgi:hypothetical protein
VLLEKLINFQLIKKVPSFYGTRMFITTFTCSRHLSLSLTSSIQSMTSQTIVVNVHLILSSQSRLVPPCALLSSGFSHRNPVYTYYLPMRAMFSAHRPHVWSVTIFLRAVQLPTAHRSTSHITATPVCLSPRKPFDVFFPP